MNLKYLILWLLLLTISVPMVHGQGSSHVDPIRIDSLQQLIEAQSKNSKEKVRLLNEYARLSFFNHEFEKGFDAANKARGLAKKLNFIGGEIMYNLTLATFLGGGGPVMRYYQQKALKMVHKDSDQLSKYYVDLNIPSAYLVNDDESILQELEALLIQYKKQGDIDLQTVILEKKGNCNFVLDRYEEVEQNLEEGAMFHEQSKQLFLELLYKTRLSWFVYRKGDSVESNRIANDIFEKMSQLDNEEDLGFFNKALADNYNNQGQYAIAIEYYLKSAVKFESLGNLNELSQVYHEMGYVYETLELYSKAVETYEKYIGIFEKFKSPNSLREAYSRIVFPLYYMKDYKRAREYMDLALALSKGKTRLFLKAKSNMLEGQIFMDEEKFDEALSYLHKANNTFSKMFDTNLSAKYGISFVLLYITECYHKKGDLENALKYALKCIEVENSLNSSRTLIKEKINFLISKIYIDLGQTQNAYESIKLYQKIISDTKETENTNKVAEDLIRSVIEESDREKEILEKEKIQKVQEARIQRIWIFSIAGAFISAIILSLVLYRNNQNKQKANVILTEQKKKIQHTLEKLKAAQSQLIQSEKMASLGELTAGIAHEIQNPLNFVNNFSEVSEELLAELEDEIKDDAQNETQEIITSLKQNLLKISHHGKRASGIVKGMLDHSRSSGGTKEATDINMLADEYLRLAYHGLRAKDKSFNADFKTDLYELLPKLKVVTQDIGRVLLNLINNAFFAVNERAKTSDSSFKPLVKVGTTLKGDQVEISVSDNGLGIPDSIKQKIFQPFFTTKPTGKGTGLGLSLSYDIINAHGGKLEVNSKENRGTEFKVILPLTS